MISGPAVFCARRSAGPATAAAGRGRIRIAGVAGMGRTISVWIVVGALLANVHLRRRCRPDYRQRAPCRKQLDWDIAVQFPAQSLAGMDNRDRVAVPDRADNCQHQAEALTQAARRAEATDAITIGGTSRACPTWTASTPRKLRDVPARARSSEEIGPAPFPPKEPGCTERRRIADMPAASPIEVGTLSLPSIPRLPRNS